MPPRESRLEPSSPGVEAKGPLGSRGVLTAPPRERGAGPEWPKEGRGGGIRTRDNEHPKLVHYQAVRLPGESAATLADGLASRKGKRLRRDAASLGRRALTDQGERAAGYSASTRKSVMRRMTYERVAVLR